METTRKLKRRILSGIEMFFDFHNLFKRLIADHAAVRLILKSLMGLSNQVPRYLKSRTRFSSRPEDRWKLTGGARGSQYPDTINSVLGPLILSPTFSAQCSIERKSPCVTDNSQIKKGESMLLFHDESVYYICYFSVVSHHEMVCYFFFRHQ